MGYKLLGLAVWRGARWFLRRRYATHLKLAAGLAVIAGVVGLAVKGRAE